MPTSSPNPDAADQLFGAYINEDWPVSYETPWEAVDDFVKYCGADQADKAAAYLQSLLDSRMDEREIKATLYACGMNYLPDTTYAEFVAAVIARLRAVSTAESPST